MKRFILMILAAAGCVCGGLLTARPRTATEAEYARLYHETENDLTAGRAQFVAQSRLLAENPALLNDAAWQLRTVAATAQIEEAAGLLLDFPASQVPPRYRGTHSEATAGLALYREAMATYRAALDTRDAAKLGEVIDILEAADWHMGEAADLLPSQ